MAQRKRPLRLDLTPAGKRWVIVNLDDDPDDSLPGVCAFRLRAEKKPSVIYESRDDAERELARLARRYPGGVFYLFETIAVGVCVATCAGAVGRVDLLA